MILVINQTEPKTIEVEDTVLIIPPWKKRLRLNPKRGKAGQSLYIRDEREFNLEEIFEGLQDERKNR